jgi:hypothetical protein
MLLSAWCRSRSSRALIELAIAVLAALPTTACTVLVDRNRQQCSTNEDCRLRGEAFAGSTCVDFVCAPDPTWACLAVGDAPPPAESRKYTVTIRIRDLVTEQPMPGVVGRLCRKLDITCSQPVGGEIPADQDGNLVVEVEPGFDGYAELRAKDKMPGLYFFFPPVQENRDVPFVPLLPPAVLAQFAQLNGKQLIAGRGHVLLGAYDCLRRPAEGIHLSSVDGDADTAAFYVLEKFPKVVATETDRSGRGGFINVPPGPVAVAGDLADGRHVASVSVLIRPGTITYTSLTPLPR